MQKGHPRHPEETLPILHIKVYQRDEELSIEFPELFQDEHAIGAVPIDHLMKNKRVTIEERFFYQKNLVLKKYLIIS